MPNSADPDQLASTLFYNGWTYLGLAEQAFSRKSTVKSYFSSSGVRTGHQES